MIARIVRSADFERVLRTRSRASSAHFAVHHVPESPSVPAKAIKAGISAKLSTGEGVNVIASVDDSVVLRPPAAPQDVWLGAVVPKRHAKRSVTRTLLKRQIRAVVGDQTGELANGLWVIRLRAPFDRQRFVSAASDELKRVARTELQLLLASAARAVGAR